MIDLHCHILPGLDDGASDQSVSIAMARAFVAEGVEIVACTPHILPGLYHNTGPAIRQAVTALQGQLTREGIGLRLTTGADIHVAPDLVQGLRAGRLPTLADSRYLLIEPPHHVPPLRLDETLFQLLVAGYVPVLTHPERLSWIRDHYPLMRTLAERGVWMQITAGSLLGRFGKGPTYWAERMLDEGLVHILATDAHDMARRPPDLAEGRARAARLVGAAEAEHLVRTRPMGILADLDPAEMIWPEGRRQPEHSARRAKRGTGVEIDDGDGRPMAGISGAVRGFGRRLRQLLD